MLSELINGVDLDLVISSAIQDIHKNGPISASTFESISYLKKFHSEFLKKYESKLMHLMGLFYKAEEPSSTIEAVYSSYGNAIREKFGKSYTPLQAIVSNGIDGSKYFTFSAPTSAGKSFLMREVIKKCQNDVVIIVPSRALIAEYYYDLIVSLDKSVLVMQFAENIFQDVAKRRVYILTPERATELFKYADDLKVDLILMDEAQISEEEIRGVKFDAFVRRSDALFANAKKVFAHPFVKNPEAQLEKHNFTNTSSFKNFEFNSVGKIFLSHKLGEFSYFSPHQEGSDSVLASQDVVEASLMDGGTILVYVSKKSIYSGTFATQFAKYIELCKPIQNPVALEIINELRLYLGVSRENLEKQSNFLDMMEFGIVIHHGSMPLKARLLIEKFIRGGYARICFATSTLSQGINMPFDIVWIFNFTRMNPLALKNLIGRSGRSSQNQSHFDYGLTIINSKNVTRFKRVMKKDVTLESVSKLDVFDALGDDDLVDMVDSIKTNTFNDDLNLPQIQIDRMVNSDIEADIHLILDSFIVDGEILTGKKYYEMPNGHRNSVKAALRKIYLSHLKRQDLTAAESSILSSAIPLMLWRIQGKSFSEIVSLRHSYLSRRDERRQIQRQIKSGEITVSAGNEMLLNLSIKFSTIAFSLPDRRHKNAPLYKQGTSVNDIDYDTIIYDTYDFLDRVISLSLADPLCAAFDVYFKKTNDNRAMVIKNLIKYGANNPMEIWLLRYGFDPEDISWILEHVEHVNERKIVFKESINSLSKEQLVTIDRFI